MKKYTVMVEYYVEVEASSDFDALQASKYLSLYDTNIHNLSMRVLYGGRQVTGSQSKLTGEHNAESKDSSTSS